MATTYTTVFGSLDNFEKGKVDVIADDPRHYAFSNIFDVASTTPPYEKVAVALNRQYVLEAIRAEGTSGWRAAEHDEFVLCMDGEVEIRFVQPDEPLVAPGTEGSVAVDGEPSGTPMGRVVVRNGHLALLPGGVAYRFHADRPAALLQQGIVGEGTTFRWDEICQTEV